jgi:hypothetical protein
LKRATAIIGVLGFVYLAGRIVILASGNVETFFDSFSYASSTDPTLNRGPLVSFTGHSPRLWGAPLLFSLFSSDRARATAQWMIATAAWASVALVLSTLVRRFAVKITLASLTLLLALTPQVASWDLAILSESLSISLGLITFACLIGFARDGSRVLLSIGIVSGLWWTFTRPEIRLFVALVAAMLVWIAVRSRAHRRPASIAALLLVGAIGWCTAIAPTVQTTFARWSATGLSLQEETFVFRLMNVIYADPAIQRVYERELGMPACAGAVREARARKPQVRELADAYRGCPDLKTWGEQNAQNATVRFARVAPIAFARLTLDRMPASFAGSTVYGDAPHIIPGVVQMLFPSNAVGTLAVVFGGLGIGAAAFAFARAHRSHRAVLFIAAMLIATAFASQLAGLLFAGSEYQRMGIQEAIMVRIAAILLICAAVDAFLVRSPSAPHARRSLPTDQGSFPS